MAAGDNFCLRLNEFERNIRTSWMEFQAGNDFCDVTLACDDRQIQTHKMIISSFSPVLRNILKHNLNPHPLIYLRKVKYKNLQNLLNFMYQGQVNIAQEDLPSFLEIAEDLKIRGLCKGNKEGFSSKQKEPLQFHIPNTVLSPKRKKSEECDIMEHKSDINQSDIKMENNSDKNVIDSFTEYQQHFEYATDSDKDIKRHDLLILNETKSSTAKMKKTDHGNNEKTISVVGGKKFVCKNCDKQFNQISHFNRHVRSVHEGESYPCQKCSYKATRNETLKRHIESVHEGIRYPCDQCEHKATQKDNLKAHIRSFHEKY